MFRWFFNRSWARKRSSRGPLESVPGSNVFLLRKDKRYRATITLTGFESWAGNATIEEKFAELGFADAKVSGSGGKRKGEARWPKPDTNVPLPLDPHLSEVAEIA